MTKELTGFAEACYNHNTFDELIDALCERRAATADCNDWNITPTMWRQDIAAALRQKIRDAKESAGLR